MAGGVQFAGEVRAGELCTAGSTGLGGASAGPVMDLSGHEVIHSGGMGAGGVGAVAHYRVVGREMTGWEMACGMQAGTV